MMEWKMGIYRFNVAILFPTYSSLFLQCLVDLYRMTDCISDIIKVQYKKAKTNEVLEIQ